MKLTRIFQYAYLVFAALFLYDVVMTWIDEQVVAYISLGLAALAIFMFFFKKRFNNKLEDRNNK
ncbi:hypothetical protein ITJ86_01570 [Winogradskyella sp. F6397]|uniref:Uncharacterized protein n=1 Tax=Winogradskyella marina TaxID=2785530 RepID=A0ABS0EDQ2_9FLAO|nr:MULTISPECIES: hypothetical protein [Winogradskyella]MBF8148565.1 hypothetical protein [Winogradskyella marina]